MFDTHQILVYNHFVGVYNLTNQISEQEIVARHTFLQRVGARGTGGGRTDGKRIVNGLGRVHPKLWRVGWNGCRRYRAKVSEVSPVLEREVHFTGGIANPFRPVTVEMDFLLV